MSASVTDLLASAGVSYELLPHPWTGTAAAEAAALGLPQEEVAKTVVLVTPAGCVRALLPASERLDLQKVRDVLDESDVRLASEEELASLYREFELGAVPPVGGGRDGERVVADRSLMLSDSLVVEAGSHERSLRVGTADLLRLTSAAIADIRQH